jgi:putative transposase
MRAFYLIVKRVVQRPPDTIPDPAQRQVVSLDPGARSFNTFYRPDGLHGEVLCGAEKHMRWLCKYSDYLRSARDTAPTPAMKETLGARMLRVNARLTNFMRNSHYEVAKELFKMADFIVLPIFNSGRMVRRAERVFSSNTARQLYTWSHYKFMQRVWQKVQTTENKQVAFTSEPGTTKTCDACGHIHPSVKGNKIFTCPSCSYTVGRDFHGARGNLLAAYGFAQP